MPLIVLDRVPPLDVGALARSGLSHICIAIPAQNEVERIGACLAAFSRQTTHEAFSIVVLANNCTDGTRDAVRAFAQASPIHVTLIEASWPIPAAPAAFARRLSVNAAMIAVGHTGVVMMTDADTVVSETWIEENMRALRTGADLVCGVVSPDIGESVLLPGHVLQRGAQEFVLENEQIQLECLLDDLPWDPWPRHRTESAASIACRVSFLFKVGGVPVVEPGEDKAFVGLVRRAGGRVRHSTAVGVTTSCRLDGRARGGWADNLRQRVEDPDAPCHPSLEPTLGLFRRAALRGQMRKAWPDIQTNDWSMRLGVKDDLLRRCCEALEFEEAWAAIEGVSPRMVHERIGAGRIQEEHRRAVRLREMLGAVRSSPSMSVARHSGG